MLWVGFVGGMVGYLFIVKYIVMIIDFCFYIVGVDCDIWYIGQFGYCCIDLVGSGYVVDVIIIDYSVIILMGGLFYDYYVFVVVCGFQCGCQISDIVVNDQYIIVEMEMFIGVGVVFYWCFIKVS